MSNYWRVYTKTILGTKLSPKANSFFPLGYSICCYKIPSHLHCYWLSQVRLHGKQILKHNLAGRWFILQSVLESNMLNGKEKEGALDRGRSWAAAQSQWRSQPTSKRLKLDGPAELLRVGLYTQHGPVIRCGLLWEGVWLWMMRISSAKEISIGTSTTLSSWGISPSSLKGDLDGASQHPS